MNLATHDVVEWLGRYVDVWKSGDASRVVELFSDDAVYYADPFAVPLRGTAEIADFWHSSGDAPDSFTAHYEPVTVTGNLAVATGFSRYFDTARSRVEQEFGNIFVLRFADDGRCTEYREWYMVHEGGATST
jgi:ketosteroid isomerase-like protein